MNKSLLLALALLVVFHTCVAQSWQPVGQGIGTNDQTETVHALTVYNGQLIAGGTFFSAGGVTANDIASWDGINWHPIGSGIQSSQSGLYFGVKCLAVYNGELYAGGAFDNAGGVTVGNIAKWNGTSWLSVNGAFGGISGGTSEVNSLTVYKGLLYAGGYFVDTIAGDSVVNIERYDGTAWSKLPRLQTASSNHGTVNGILGNNLSYVQCLLGFGDYLAIGGVFETSANPGFVIRNAGLWNSSWFVPMVDTIGNTGEIASNGTSYPEVSSMVEHQGNLYVSGTFDSIGNLVSHNIGSYNLGGWQAVPTMGGNIFGTPLGTYNGSLIGQGLMGSGTGAYAFDGTGWHAIGGVFGGTYPEYHAICEYNGDLYVGGQFTQNGSTSIMNIAKWSGALGVHDITEIKAVIYPNPALQAVTISNVEPYAPVHVSDIFGRIVASGTTDGKGSVTISVSSLPQGMYFANGSKFVKQ